MKPIIGITSSVVKLEETKHGVYVHQDYFRSVQACGGLPIILPLTDPDAFMELIDLCDGVIFSGGEDVDPKFYGAEPQQHLGATLPERDEVEIAAVQYTVGQKKPLLAICRGLQVLNVALGGTLYQDLPSQYPGALQHSQKAARGIDTHWVDLTDDSVLYQILGETRLRVNSLHHQAIEKVAKGLVVTGLASDGVIESVEDPNAEFLIGVQWHPESMCERDELMKKLFQAFIQKCSVTAQEKVLS